MRPIKLTLQAFGAFANKIEIPFDKLGLANIYLISGVTGSGKTTIFDAICFALFNSSSGSNRGNANFRSHFASNEVASFVEFEFSFNNQTYKIIRNPSYVRAKTRGEGFVNVQSSAQLFLPDGKIIEKSKEVDEYIENLLGLDVVQFSQIALLAQGEFLKLLNSDTQHRGEIFRSIFKTWKYAKFQDEIKKIATETKLQYEKLEASILQYIQDIVSDNEAILDLKNKFIENNTFVNLDELIILLEKQVENDRVSLLEFQKNINTLEKEVNFKQVIFQNIQNKNQLIYQKEQISINLLQEEAEFEKIKKEYLNIPALKEEIKKIVLLIEKSENNYKKAFEIKENINALNNLNVDKTNLLSEIDVFKKDYLQHAFNQYHELNASLLALQEEFLKCKDENDELSKKYSENYNKYLIFQAGIIAQNLKDNTPCPVCGSLIHPCPAENLCEDLTYEFIESQKELLNKSVEKLSNLSSKCALLKQDSINALNEFEKLSKKFDFKIEQKYSRVQNNDYSKLYDVLVEKLSDKENEILCIQTKLNMLKNELDNVDLDLIEKEYNELKFNLENIEKNVLKIEKDYNDKNLYINNLNSNLKLLNEQIEKIDVNGYDQEKLEGEISIIKHDLQNITIEVQNTLSTLSLNENILKSLIEKNKEYKLISKNYSDCKILNECANGNIKGKQRLAFEQYIQGYYLDLVLYEANKHLKVMSKNQFQLSRKIDSFANNSKSGLEIEVMDFHTYTKRPVKTLSGGESFKAALSLALGLSDCVSNLSGAINIDAMFIDEGFGSLDSESLELAVDVIFNLANNRVIGVISHIDDLKTKIQNQIIAIKTTHGSNISVNF